jgi:hypothetical protein
LIERVRGDGSHLVVPAKAGTHLLLPILLKKWTLAFAGMTKHSRRNDERVFAIRATFPFARMTKA